MEIVQPKIELIASTALTMTAEGPAVIESDMPIDQDSTDSEALITRAGRGCYEAYGRPNPATAKDADYIRRTAFDMQHGSILEHASATFRFSGVSRACLLELERHRHLSWSVVSQRYVDANTFGVVMPPALRDGDDAVGRDMWESGVAATFEEYDGWCADLALKGFPRKQAREAARSVLPNCTEVRGVVTGNLRAWSTILPLRAHPTADAEIQEVSRLIADALEPVAPTVVQHIKEQMAYAELLEERPDREAVLARRKRIGERHNKEHA